MWGNCYSFSCVNKRSLQNMSGSFSVRGCTAQPFSTALPTKSNSFSGTEDKAVLGKRSGYLFKVRFLRIWESCITQCRAKKGTVCALGALAGDGEQSLPTCSSPAPGTAEEPGEVLSTSLRAVVAPFSSSSLPGKGSLVRSHFGSL